MKFIALLLLTFWLLDAKTLLRTQVIMATLVTITADKEDENLIADGFNIMKSVEMSLSSYDPKANVFLLNKNLHTKVDNYLYEALLLSKEYYEKTDGYFDITVGSITKDLYRFGEDERVATLDELDGAKVGFKALWFDADKAFLQKGFKVDLGGMGKGYGVDKVAEHFRKNGVSSAVIAASGDIRCLGLCRVEVQNPFNDEKVLLSFETQKPDLGITTSGNYNRYVTSTKNNHLIDPKTKRAQSSFISITLVGELKSSDLDAYATAASVMPPHKAYAFLESLGVGYIIVQSDKKMVISPNKEKYMKIDFLSDTFKKYPQDEKNEPQKEKK